VVGAHDVEYQSWVVDLVHLTSTTDHELVLFWKGGGQAAPDAVSV
jgi:hypothetical protein